MIFIYKVLPYTIVLLTIALFTTVFSSNSSASQTEISYKPLTEQIWAVKLEVEPGEKGNLSQNFEAAYGAYDAGIEGDSAGKVQKDSFGIDYDDDGSFEVLKGKDYVGNYFKIEQEVGTTGGTIKRHIDISSPWSGAYVHEDMVVEGRAEIEDTFRMDNLKPGEDAEPDWHELF